MEKTVDLTKNAAALCAEYPELIDILVGLGFKPLANPIMRKTIGSKVTIPKASEMMGVSMEKILFALAENGFAVTGADAAADEEQKVEAGDAQKEYSHEAGHTFLARMGKTKLRPGGAGATEWLLGQAKITPETKILEVACNMGTTMIQIAEQYGCRLTGLDLDENALKNAEANIKEHHLEDRITLVHGSAFELPFDDGSFDIVINEAMLTMLLGDKKDQALAEYHRVLKPGGILLTQDVCMRTDDAEEQKEILSGISRAINVHVEPLTVAGWKERFERNGFSVTEKVGQMTLLDPDGMEKDEGKEKTQEILMNAMKPENADRFFKMFGFFNSHKDQLGYIAAASTKEA